MPLVIDVILKLKVSGVYTEFLLSKDIFWKKKKGSLFLSLLEFKVFEGFIPQRFHYFPLFPHSEVKHKKTPNPN